jgi:DNA-binding transcriptional LysR family regulator
MGIRERTESDHGQPQGPVSFDESDPVAQAVLDGVGIGAMLEESVKELTAKKKLKQVLKDWCPVFPGFFLYYPSRRNQPAALTALIETLRFTANSLSMSFRVRY